MFFFLDTQRFMCGDCSRVYKYKSSLVHHQRYECGKSGEYPCSVCAYKGKQPRALAAHMLIEHGLKTSQDKS